MSGSLSPFPLLLRCLVLMVPDSNQRLWELPLGPDLEVRVLRDAKLKPIQNYSQLSPTIPNYLSYPQLSLTILNNTNMGIYIYISIYID